MALPETSSPYTQSPRSLILQLNSGFLLRLFIRYPKSRNFMLWYPLLVFPLFPLYSKTFILDVPVMEEKVSICLLPVGRLRAEVVNGTTYLLSILVNRKQPLKNWGPFLIISNLHWPAFIQFWGWPEPYSKPLFPCNVNYPSVILRANLGAKVPFEPHDI